MSAPADPKQIKAALRWEKQYAKRAMMTVAELRSFNRIVVPCACGKDGCQGWQSVNRTEWEIDPWVRQRNGGEGWTWPPEGEK